MSRIVDIPSSPAGYADDLSMCTLSKYKLDQALKLVYDYSCRWRFYYNADKSAVMMYGESKPEAKRNSKYRNFILGKEKVRERGKSTTSVSNVAFFPIIYLEQKIVLVGVEEHFMLYQVLVLKTKVYV